MWNKEDKIIIAMKKMKIYCAIPVEPVSAQWQKAGRNSEDFHMDRLYNEILYSRIIEIWL